MELLEGRLTPAIVSLTPVADNTLFEDSTGNLSDGAGAHFYIGTSNQSAPLNTRRGLLKFDVASIPAGSTINSATLKLNVSKVPSGAPAEDVAVHLAQQDWGEGTSDASQGGTGSGEGDGIQATTDDATWLFTFFNTQSWTNPGGDFDAAVSSTTNVTGLGSYQWTGLASDVQGWVDSSATNFGWLLTGNETTAKTARQFDSRESPTSANRPTLTIDFTPPPPDLTIDKSHSGNFTQGDTADTYTIVVSNSGAGPTNGSVTVTDILPSGLLPTAADSGTISGWNVSFISSTITATRSDPLAVGNSYPDLTLTVSVADNATNLVNTATVFVSGESNTANNSDDDPTAIDPGQVNQAPVNTLPSSFAGTEDMPLSLTGLSVTDPDAGAQDLRVNLSVNSGTLAVTADILGGLTSSEISGNGTGFVVLTAPQSTINTTLAAATGLTFSPLANFNGNVSLSMLTSDLGHTGISGPKTDLDNSTISVAAVNDAPVLTLPESFATTSDSTSVLSGISIADVDAGSNLVSLVLSATNGPLILSTSVLGGVSSAEVSGNGSGTLSLLSTMTRINSTLADSTGLIFAPNAGFSGTATLTVVVNDLGNSGGGPLVDAGSASIVVSPLLDHFTIDLPAMRIAGVPFAVTITARNQAGDVVTNFGGTVDLSTGDLQGSLPAQAGFTNGVASFQATLKTAGAQTITAFDSTNASLQVQGSVGITPATPAKLVFVQQPQDTLLNAPFLVPVRIAALDAFDNLESGDNSESIVIRLQNNTVGAKLNGTTHVRLVNGIAEFTNLALTRAGDGLVLSASAATLPVTFSDPFSVVAVTRFSVVTTTTLVTAGLSINVKVQALDAKGQVVPNYPGLVHFSSTDPIASLPADATLVAGQGTFPVVLKTAVDSKISVNDLAKPTVKGALKFPVSVTHRAATGLRFTSSSISKVGQKQKVVVSAVDEFGNLDTEYQGTVLLGSSDVNAVLPGPYAFTAKDAGKHTFSVTFKTPGLRNLEVHDSSFSASQMNIVVYDSKPAIVAQSDVETGTTLVVIGTSGNNVLTVQPASPTGDQLEVLFNGVSQGTTFAASGHVLIYGVGGNDTLRVLEGAGALAGVTVPNSVVIDGGTGNDILDASGASGNAILLGGDGNDSLTGSGERDILIGGRGKDTLHGGNGDDILVAGATTLDGDLTAILTLMREWSDPGTSFLDRVQHLSGITTGGLNDPYYFKGAAISNDTSVDQLFGEGDADWFLFAANGKILDQVLDPTDGEFLMGL